MINMKLLSLSVLTALVSFSATVNAEDAPTGGEKTYKEACFACHDTGAANAPKLSDKAAWAPRIALGKEVLYASSITGKGAMPPKGGRVDLSDDVVKAAVDYIISKVSDEAAKGDAKTEEPAKDDATKTDATKDAAKTEEPAKDDATKDAAKVEEPAKDDAAKDAAKTEEPTAKDDATKTEEPVAKDATAKPEETK